MSAIDITSIETICRTGIPGYDPWAHPAGCTFDPEQAMAPIRFFREQLIIPDGDTAGAPFDPLPWQQAILGNLFGWFRPDGTRRYRVGFILVPQKNGKTPLASGILLFTQCARGFPGSQAFFAAADRSQASIGFDDAAAMVLDNDELSAAAKIMRSYKTIEFTGTGQIIRALSSDAKTKHGLRPYVFVADEIHAHQNGALVSVLHKKTAGQAQPLEIYITTADFQRESMCNEKHDAALAVLEDHSLDPYMLPVIYAAPADADYSDPEVWKACNPSFGITKKAEYFDQELRKIAITPSELNEFKRLDLNIRTGQDVAWLDMAAWNECPESTDADLVGPCFGGLDLASTSDLTAFALYWPETHAIRFWSWLPESQLGGKNKIQYVAWHRAGHLVSTPGNVTDYGFVRQRINEIAETYSPGSIGYDPYNARQLCDNELYSQDGLPMVEFRQGFISMSGPSKEMERLVISRKLKHGGNPLVKWCASNAAVRTDPAGNIKPVKPENSNHKKIDPLVAGIIAIGTSIVSDPPPEPQIFFS